MAAVDFKIINNFFTPEELKVYESYCLNKLDAANEYRIDCQSFSPSWYDDPLMVALLNTKLPFVEKETNLQLLPAYAYWRYYIFGATLNEHTDREPCEISISVCIKKYDDWPFTIEDKEFELEEGQAILYAGCDQKHGRPGVYKGEGMAQMFLHYVNKNGPNAKFAYFDINSVKQL